MPNLKDEVAVFEDEEDVPKPVNSGFVCDFTVSHAIHLVESALFCTRHTSQFQLPSGFLNLSKPRQPPDDRETEGAMLLLETGTELPGFSDIQDTHLLSSALLETQHTGHSQDPTGLLNLSANPKAPVVTVQLEEEAATVTALSEATGNVRTRLTPVPGFGVSQATHFIASGLFCTKQVSQSQVPTAGLNLSPKPAVPGVERVTLPLLLGVPAAVCLAESLGSNFVAWQATHLLSVTLFWSRQVSHCHDDPAFKPSPNPVPLEEKLLIAGLV